MERKTLTALGIFVALGVIAIFTLRAPQRGERVTAKPRPLPRLTKDQIEKVTISRKGERVTLVRRGSAWFVSSPVSYAADKYATETLEKKLSELAFGDLISEREDRQAEFEVDPQKGVRVQISHGDKTVADFYLGKTVSGFTMFRLEGQKKVWQAAGSLRNVFDKELKNWRDKRIFSFKEAKVRGLELMAGAQTTRLGRKDAKSPWSVLTSPITLPKLDANALRHALSTFSSLTTSDFADSTTPAQAGLDHPRGIVKATLEGQTTYTLEIGKKLKEFTYARVAGKKQIFKVSNGSIAALLLRPIDLKDKTVLTFDPTKVRALTLEKRAGESVDGVILRRDLKNPKTWFGASLGAGASSKSLGKKIDDTTKLTAALKLLSKLQADHFARMPETALGLTPSAWTLTLELEDGTRHHLSVGSKLIEQSRALRVKGNPDLFMVRDYVSKQFLLDPKNYR